MIEKEVWRDVPGYDGLYQCSNIGRVKRLAGSTRTAKDKIRAPQDRGGYESIALFKKGKREYFYVHRLVAKCFLPNPNNLPLVNHKDETRDNNHVDNLEWCTHQQNITYGTSLKRKNRKLSEKIEGTHIETGEKIYFPSMMEAARNGFVQSSISLCCNGKMEQHKKYTWKKTKNKTERGD